MAIIKPELKTKFVKKRVSLESELLDEINCYCEWANISTVDHFFSEAIRYVLSRDRDWKFHQDSAKEVAA